MPLVTNSYEGYTTAGTTISAANSGGNSGTAFDIVGVGSGGTLVSATGAAHGNFCASLIDTSAASTYMQWTSNGAYGAQTTTNFRLYAKASANPGTGVRLFNNTTAGGSLMSVFLNTTGKLSVTYSSVGTAFVTFTALVPLNSWFRVEGFVIVSTTVGQVSASLFSTGLDNPVPDETHTSAASLNVGTLSGTTSYSFGDSSAITMTSAILYDDVGLSSFGPLGPAVAPPAPRATLTAVSRSANW